MIYEIWYEPRKTKIQSQQVGKTGAPLIYVELKYIIYET